MASNDSSTSSSITAVAPQETKRTVDEAFLNKLKSLVERLRLENTTLKKSLDLERSGVRALKAQHEATVRIIKTEYKKKEEFLEKQLRTPLKTDRNDDQPANKFTDFRKLTTEIQSLKAENKGLQEKLKVAQSAECARAAELRAQVAKHAALEEAARRDARAQCHRLLEEIKSKERVIIQLKREAARVAASLEYDQVQRMDCVASDIRKRRIEQGKEKTNREDLKTDIQHRKETFYREASSDGDSAISSAPASLSPQPLNDMWSCTQCRAANDRALVASREASRLSDALRDARDQLELMEFRILELEDAHPDKGARDNLTDSDSGCVSPGSRIKDSASPELKRMDSGYKSPHAPSSPCNQRRHLGTPHDDFKEDFAKAQVLADILDRNSETSDSLRSNPVKEHLEQMILNAGSAEDRSCLEQVLMLLYNYQALSSSVSEDECYQVKPRRICDLKVSKYESDYPSTKIQKAVATVTPYQQKGFKSQSFESLCSEERKPNSILQESGIFEGVETECRSTQTEVNDSFEFSGDLNTEIQRLNSIREKLEKQGVRSRALNNKEEGDGLECRCVKLGKKHKQYYERRLKFLEGKISIYEAAQDVKASKLAERLQKEFILENRIQELESQLSELQDKYERLEEECCELEEIENDTRLHWQQLEMEYEVMSAQVRDLAEQRESARARAARLAARQADTQRQESELQSRLDTLEKAVPALIAWNVVQAVGYTLTPRSEQILQKRIRSCINDNRDLVNQIKQARNRDVATGDQPEHERRALCSAEDAVDRKIMALLEEKKQLEEQAKETKRKLEEKIESLQVELDMLKRQASVAEWGGASRVETIVKKIEELENESRVSKAIESIPADPELLSQIETLQRKQQETLARIAEMERREAAYLEMLTQADDMWADMEGGYKKKIKEVQFSETCLKNQVKQLESERDDLGNCLESLKKKLRDIQESESSMRIELEKAHRDKVALKNTASHLEEMLKKAELDSKNMERVLKNADGKFHREVEKLRRLHNSLDEELKEVKQSESKCKNDLECLKKELYRVGNLKQELEVTNSELKEEVESLEKQLNLTQKALSQCKRKCDEKMNVLSHELSLKTEELEEMRSESMRQSLHASRIDLLPDKTEYIDEGYPVYTAVPKKTEYGRMHHSLSFITTEPRCSCPSMRSQLVGQLIEDLFERMHNVVDDDLVRLCQEISVTDECINEETKAKVTNYLLMAISKELVRSIGDADAKTDTEEWQRVASSLTFPGVRGGGGGSGRGSGSGSVSLGAARLASVSCACAAARLAAARPALAHALHRTQEEVLNHGDVKIMEEQLANAIESIVNCPSCALGTNAIVWSTDV